MRCPCCGSPVMIRGDRWECGYCGDSGFLQQEEPEITVTFSLDEELWENPWEIYENLKKSLLDAVPGGENLIPLLEDAMLYQISDGLCCRKRPLSREEQRQLREFLSMAFSERTGDILIPLSLQGKRICMQEGRLDSSFCGTFWQRLIQSTQGQELPDLQPFFGDMANAYAFLMREECNAAAFERSMQLEESFARNWYARRYAHPDEKEALQKLQATVDDGLFDAHCRDLLMLKWPELFEGCSEGDLCYFSLEDLLEDQPSRERAMAVWQYLSDLAGPGKNYARARLDGIKP